jgi:hypothetical protein
VDLLNANELSGNGSFASWPSKTVRWICAKAGNKGWSFLSGPSKVAFEVTYAPQGTDRNKTQALFKFILYVV